MCGWIARLSSPAALPYFCIINQTVARFSGVCKHIGKERIAQIKAWYGPNDPYTMSVLEGQFMDYGAGIPHVIEHAELEAWRNKTIGVLAGPRVFACDFARGGDDNVLLLREVRYEWKFL
jgi:hypothetical protein